MTFEQANTRAPDDSELTKIVERADEDEIRALVEKQGAVQDTLKNRISAEESLEETAENSMSFLERAENLVNELIAFIKDANNSTEDKVAKLKANLGMSEAGGIVGDMQEGIQDFAKKQIEEQVSKIPFGKQLLGVFNSYDENSEEKPWYGKIISSVLGDEGKTMIAGIFGFFGVKGIAKYMEGDFSDFEMPEVAKPVVDVPTVKVPSTEGLVSEAEQEGTDEEGEISEDVNTVEENKEYKEKIETRKGVYSGAALLMLRQTSGIDFKNNESHNDVFDIVENEKHIDISNAYLAYLDNEKDENRYAKLCAALKIDSTHPLYNREEKVVAQLEAMVGTNARLLIKGRLNDIPGLVKQEEFKKYFGDYGSDFKDMTFEQLTYHDLTILLSYSMPSLLGVLAENAKNGITTAYFGASENAKEFLDELKERRTVEVSQDLWEAFNKIGVVSFGDPADVKKDQNSSYREKVLSNGKNLSKADENTLDEIIVFKDEIISNFKTDPLLSGYEGFEELFDVGVNYSEIVSLYLLLDGNSSIENLDITGKTGVFGIVGNILDTQGHKERFFSYLGNKAFDGLEKGNDYFTSAESYFILSNLNNYAKGVLEELLTGPNYARKFISATLVEQIPSNVEIDDYEWGLIAFIIGAPAAAAAVPVFGFWFKIAAMGTSALGVSMALGKLNESGTLKKIVEEEGLKETKDKLDAAMRLAGEGSLQEYIDNNSTD